MCLLKRWMGLGLWEPEDIEEETLMLVVGLEHYMFEILVIEQLYKL